MDAIAMGVGYAIMITCAVAVVAGALIWAAMLSNKASKRALDAYGGWETFLEFREWQKRAKELGAEPSL